MKTIIFELFKWATTNSNSPKHIYNSLIFRARKKILNNTLRFFSSMVMNIQVPILQFLLYKIYQRMP